MSPQRLYSQSVIAHTQQQRDMLRDRQLDAVVFGLPSLALQESLEAASVERRKEMAESMRRAESAEGVWNAQNAMPDQAHETPTPISFLKLVKIRSFANRLPSEPGDKTPSPASSPASSEASDSD